MIDWRYVDSSNIKAIRYDREAKKLYIRFRAQREYVYYGVKEDVFVGLLHARSKGKYHDKYIKKGGYQYKRLA